jgi:hypothetical protein
VRSLHAKALGNLAKAEAGEDLRAALLAIRQTGSPLCWGG